MKTIKTCSQHEVCSSSDSQLKCFSGVSEAALLAAVDASVESLKQQLLLMHREVKDVVRAKVKLEESLQNGSDKYSIRKMATGSIDDFHKGLADRVGERRSPPRRSIAMHLQKKPKEWHWDWVMDIKIIFHCSKEKSQLLAVPECRI